jgi:hypothetical protein
MNNAEKQGKQRPYLKGRVKAIEGHLCHILQNIAFHGNKLVGHKKLF